MEIIFQQNMNKYAILSIPTENPVIGIYLFTRNKEEEEAEEGEEERQRR